MLADAGVALLLTGRALAAGLPPASTRVVSLDDAETLAAISARPDADPDAGVTAGHLAYVIFTSGSTGRAKGVMVTHAGLTNNAFAWADRYALHGGDTRHLQMASFSFDVFTGDLVRALCSGGTLVLCPRETLLDPPALAGLLEAQRITHAEFVPAVVRPLVQHLETTGKTLPALRTLIVGSDSWHVADQVALQDRSAPGTLLFNSYGVTEATIDSLCFGAGEGDLAAGESVPIGRPLANNTAYVLDARLGPVPVGVPGELYVGGPGLARGYLGRPDLTAERFVPHPFAAAPGARLYRTGDLVRWRADGALEFLGRRDQQVKVRGFRIEPGEIEAVLGQHPAVREAVVLAREDTPGDKRLVAYVVPVAAAAPAADELRAALRGRLPDHMVPAAFVVLDSLPLNANGKVDRKILPAPEAPATGETYVAPRTALEAVVAGIWAEVLGLPRVGTEDNFFALGGHSLLVSQLVTQMRDLLQIDLPLRALFELPTVGGLCAALLQRESPQTARLERTAELLLTLSQLSEEEAGALLERSAVTALSE
jgi:amino acid adenylation domain-containing protein